MKSVKKKIDVRKKLFKVEREAVLIADLEKIAKDVLDKCQELVGTIPDRFVRADIARRVFARHYFRAYMELLREHGVDKGVEQFVKEVEKRRLKERKSNFKKDRREYVFVS